MDGLKEAIYKAWLDLLNTVLVDHTGTPGSLGGIQCTYQQYAFSQRGLVWWVLSIFVVGYVVGLLNRKDIEKTTTRPNPSRETNANKAPPRRAKDVVDREDDDENYKMVLVVRQDLGMTKGKIAAQCCHAAVGVMQDLLRQNTPESEALIKKYDESGWAKVALKAQDVKELESIYKAARAKKLPTEMIRDAGRTQIPSGSITVVAVGPGRISDIDQITGHLKLL